MSDKTRYVFDGVPVYENGKLKYVQPIRAVQANDGKWYHGELGEDEDGRKFTYNRIPDTSDPPEPWQTLFFISPLPRQSRTHYRVTADGVIEASNLIMA